MSKLLYGISLGITTCALSDSSTYFLLYPTQKLDYGILNILMNRKVKSKFWGTRLEHIMGEKCSALIYILFHFLLHLMCYNCCYYCVYY